jgi:SAM-dependent MidA family methyltransferase
VNPLEELIAKRVGRFGPLPFDQVMDLALYHPELGFYAAGGRPGRREGDFITSPEVGPLFGAVVAGALDTWWDQMGRPDPFVVVEAGAGTGMLARTVLLAEPACAKALRYVLVDRSAALRVEHGRALDLTPPPFGLGPAVLDADGLERPAQVGVGPVVVSLGELPSLDRPVVVIANELLDNLAFRVLERAERGWREVRVGIDADEVRLTEVLVPAEDDQVRLIAGLAPDAPPGARVPVQDEAGRWLRRALHLAAPGGRVVVIDYAARTAELAARPVGDWLRTYAGQGRGGDPIDRLGQQDITADVCIDQLTRVRAPVVETSQADWLRAHGIDALVDEGRRVWTERAAVADLEALRARSRVSEAEALLDAAGLGAFTVLEWSA